MADDNYLNPSLAADGYTGTTGSTPYRPTTAAQVDLLQSQYGTSFSNLVTRASPGAIQLSFNFDGTQNDIVQAFGRYRVPLPTALPATLREEFFNDPEANRRWARFIRRQHGLRADEGAARAKAGSDELPTIARALAGRVAVWQAQLPKPIDSRKLA